MTPREAWKRVRLAARILRRGHLPVPRGAIVARLKPEELSRLTVTVPVAEEELPTGWWDGIEEAMIGRPMVLSTVDWSREQFFTHGCLSLRLTWERPRAG